ncbi:MAG: hypothetical protein R6W31_12095 [Bacteroidales bacterium]
MDDNFHYMDESHRYKLGEYKTLENAVEVCKDIVDEFLHENYRPGLTSADSFSARDYASERVKEICQSD